MNVKLYRRLSVVNSEWVLFHSKMYAKQVSAHKEFKNKEIGMDWNVLKIVGLLKSDSYL